MKKINNKKIIIFLVVLLLISLSYIAFQKYEENKKNKLDQIYKQGLEDGYSESIKQIIDALATCQPVPIYAGEKVVNAIAIECLINDLPECNPMTLSLGNESVEMIETSCLQ